MLGRTLLIIDDDSLWRKLTASHFSLLKYNTYYAGTCAQGIALAEKLRPDFILLDYHLKDGNAPEVASHIRASENLKKTLLFIISGDETRREAAYSECQADHFILKGTKNSTIHEIMCSLRRRVFWERGIVEKGDLRLEAVSSRVFRGSKPLLQLSDDRFALLSLLIEKSPETVNEAVISKRVYNSELTQEKSASVKMLVHRLRQDLGPLAVRVRNQRGEGWAYSPPCPEKDAP